GRERRRLLTTREPEASPFPTVRFVPPAQVRATVVVVQPSDLWLLALRVATVLLVGVALAGPRLAPRRQRVATLVATDASRAVRRRRAGRGDARDSCAVAGAHRSRPGRRRAAAAACDAAGAGVGRFGAGVAVLGTACEGGHDRRRAQRHDRRRLSLRAVVACH